MTEMNVAGPEYIPADDSTESLRQTHQQLEQRLEKLDRQRSLSPEEEFEMQVLKKRKLALKDQLLARQQD